MLESQLADGCLARAVIFTKTKCIISIFVLAYVLNRVNFVHTFFSEATMVSFHYVLHFILIEYFLWGSTHCFIPCHSLVKLVKYTVLK